MNSSEYFLYKLTGGDYKRIINNLPRLAVLFDQQGTIIYWNKAGEKIFGYTSGEILGKPVWLLYPGSNQNDLIKDFEKLKKGEVISMELEARHKDGSKIWVDIQRVLIKLKKGSSVILGSVSDISSQIKAELDLAKSEARIQAVLETAVEGILTTDKNGIIRSFNKAAENIFGYASNEVKGKNVSILMPSPHRENHDGYINRYFKTGIQRIIGRRREVRGMRKDGSVFPMELAVSEVKFNEEIFFSGIVRDISERRRLENEILEISEEERRRIGRDLHDGLGQMLTGIGLISWNLAQRLKSSNLPGADEVLEISNMIREADKQAKALAYGLVHIELESEGFSDAIRKLCERSKLLFKVNCKCELDKCMLIENKTTALHLYRIVQEAIHNSVKHGKANCITVRLKKQEEYVQLEVEDDGVGFSRHKNPEKKGIGMNTMSYRARILGGRLNLQKTVEGNTLLICSIPDREFDKQKDL